MIALWDFWQACHPFPVLVLAGLVSLRHSLAAYAAFRDDKARAIAGDRRIPEASLLMLAALGGWPGAKLAQRRFRHKTRKQPFGTMLNATAVIPLVMAGMFVALTALLPDSLRMRGDDVALLTAGPGPAAAVVFVPGGTTGTRPAARPARILAHAGPAP